MICPNKNLPEWKALDSLHPELSLYYWNLFEGNPPNYLTDPKVLEDLFDSNPELANQVYETLGFKTDRKGLVELVHYSSKNTNPLNNFQEDFPLYTSKGENSEYKDYGKQFNFLIKNNANIKSLTDFHGKYGIDLDKHDQFSKGIQPYHFSLQEIQAIRKEGVDILIDDWGEYIILNKNSVTLKDEQKQQAIQKYAEYLTTIFPDSKVKNIVYHGGPTQITNKFKESFTEDGNFYQGIFFSNSLNYIEELSKSFNKDLSKVTTALINSEDNFKVKEPLSYNQGQYWYFEQYDSIQGKDAGQKTKADIFAVATPEQIHILGNQKDIEGFKQFLSGPPKGMSDLEIESCE